MVYTRRYQLTQGHRVSPWKIDFFYLFHLSLTEHAACKKTCFAIGHKQDRGVGKQSILKRSINVKVAAPLVEELETGLTHLSLSICEEVSPSANRKPTSLSLRNPQAWRKKVKYNFLINFNCSSLLIEHRDRENKQVTVLPIFTFQALQTLMSSHQFYFWNWSEKRVALLFSGSQSLLLIMLLIKYSQEHLQ